MIKIFLNFSSTFTKFLSSTTFIRASFSSSVKLPMVCRRCLSVFHRIVATTFGCVDNSAAENRGIFSAQFAFSSLFRSSFSDVSAVNIRIRFAALLSLQKPSEYRAAVSCSPDGYRSGGVKIGSGTTGKLGKLASVHGVFGWASWAVHGAWCMASVHGGARDVMHGWCASAATR